MQRKDFYLLGILGVLLILIFLPLFYSDYLFMDEALELWGYNSVPGLVLFSDDGRWLTEILQGWLFRMANTIHNVTYVRWVSLFGWMACLPIWYSVIKRSVDKVPGYVYLPFFTCLYLITSVPFVLSIQWATCMQFFIADTAALVSGALVMQGIYSSENKLRVTLKFALPALVLGMASLFFYQGAFACFLLPFLLHYINPFNYSKDAVLVKGLVFYFFVNAAYFVAYKASFSLLGIVENPRNNLHLADLWEKAKFFLARPLERSFRFTLLTHEDSPISRVAYPLMLLSFGVLAFIRFGKAKWLNAVKYLAAVGGIWALAYLPGLLVKENFASNRTLLALNLFVFVACFEMALYFIRNKRVLEIAGFAMIAFFVLCARYNFQQVFLRPVKDETAALQNYFKQHYHNGIQTVHLIRPPEDFMAQKYHVNKSMDEFGVASTCWVWVPESLVKQLAYETTGNREQARGVVVKHWADKDTCIRAGGIADKTTLVVDVPEIMNSVKP